MKAVTYVASFTAWSATSYVASFAARSAASFAVRCAARVASDEARSVESDKAWNKIFKYALRLAE